MPCENELIADGLLEYFNELGFVRAIGSEEQRFEILEKAIIEANAPSN